jgi:hypothetical protein
MGGRQREWRQAQERTAALRLEVGAARRRLQLEQREPADDVTAVDVQIDRVGRVDLPALLDRTGRVRRGLGASSGCAVPDASYRHTA